MTCAPGPFAPPLCSGSDCRFEATSLARARGSLGGTQWDVVGYASLIAFQKVVTEKNGEK